mmetsp:Transcript_16474/g.51588  ORF Transcript_16474/g.51588 Transcript_16474/m.51588 type:complete len:177 (-) Transcript_16474:227-757(-)
MGGVTRCRAGLGWMMLALVLVSLSASLRSAHALVARRLHAPQGWRCSLSGTRRHRELLGPGAALTLRGGADDEDEEDEEDEDEEEGAVEASSEVFGVDKSVLKRLAFMMALTFFMQVLLPKPSVVAERQYEASKAAEAKAAEPGDDEVLEVFEEEEATGDDDAPAGEEAERAAAEA